MKLEVKGFKTQINRQGDALILKQPHRTQTHTKAHTCTNAARHCDARHRRLVAAALIVDNEDRQRVDRLKLDQLQLLRGARLERGRRQDKLVGRLVCAQTTQRERVMISARIYAFCGCRFLELTLVASASEKSKLGWLTKILTVFGPVGAGGCEIRHRMRGKCKEQSICTNHTIAAGSLQGDTRQLASFAKWDHDQQLGVAIAANVSGIIL